MAQRSGSAADFPYDERLQVGNLRGLERLRAVADRQLAEYLFALFRQAERNSVPDTRQQSGVPRANLRRVRHLALSALDGALGADAHELAAYVLLDDAGRRRLDETALLLFAEGLRRLRQ